MNRTSITAIMAAILLASDNDYSWDATRGAVHTAQNIFKAIYESIEEEQKALKRRDRAVED